MFLKTMFKNLTSLDLYRMRDFLTITYSIGDYTHQMRD